MHECQCPYTYKEDKWMSSTRTGGSFKCNLRLKGYFVEC